MKKLMQVLQNKEDNYMLPFFWQHGENEETLQEYMQAIYDANIKAVCVESRPHPDFAGKKWWADMDVILKAAKALGMKVWILDDSHFPTGFANGAMKNAPRHLKHQYMCYRTLEMAGPVCQAEFNVKEFTCPAPLPPWMPAQEKEDDDFSDNRLISILACPITGDQTLGTPIDLTGNIQNGQCVFDLPDGYFKIYVVYITRDGKGRNDYINFMDKESCRILIDAVYEPHYAHYKDYFGSVIAGFFSDEPPIGNVNGYMPVGPIGVPGQDLPWSDGAEEALTRVYGSEEWKMALPYLWAPGQDKRLQAKIRGGYMDMVTRLTEECFSRQLGGWCADHGVEYIGHMLEDCDMNMNLGASMGHFFRGLSGQHMAGVDNIGGQVTINGWDAPRHDSPACPDEAGFYHYVLGKLGASCGAIDPKKKGRTLCENFGAYGWQSGPKEQKFMLDHFMVRGVNRFVPHAFSPAPFPDPDCPPHFYAHGENPAYRAFGQLMAYGNRVCHLIDKGVPCPDVAVLYGAEGVWAGDGSSNIPVCRSLGQAQVDFHILPADVFNENKEYPTDFDTVERCVNHVSYKALIICGCRFLEKNTAKFVIEAQKTHFPIIFTDRKPEGIIGETGREEDSFALAVEKLPAVRAELVGTYLKEKGTISFDAEAQPENKHLSMYHYQLEGHDEILFLNEMAQKAYVGTVTVKASGIPVRYDPWKNLVRPVEYTDLKNGFQVLDLTVAPLELCVILFLKDDKEREALRPYFIGEAAWTFEESVLNSDIKAPDVTVKAFHGGRIESTDYLNQLKKAGTGLYPETVQTCTREDLLLHEPFEGMEKRFPDFSGYYIYETEIDLKPGQGYGMKIDEVYETVEVFFNGKSLGMKVQAPYIFYIPGENVKERNQLRIETATLPERKAKAAGASISAMSPSRPLSPTGIRGNVSFYAL